MTQKYGDDKKKGMVGGLFDLRFVGSLLYRGDILWTFPKYHDVAPGFPDLPHFILQFQTLTDFLKPIWSEICGKNIDLNWQPCDDNILDFWLPKSSAIPFSTVA